MLELYDKETIGNIEADWTARQFFKELKESDKVEITEVQYGDKRAYSGYEILEIHLTVKQPISLQDGDWEFNEGDRLILSVGIDEEFENDLSTELTEIVKVPMGKGVWWSDWDLKHYEYIDFDKAYSL